MKEVKRKNKEGWEKKVERKEWRREKWLIGVRSRTKGKVNECKREGNKGNKRKKLEKNEGEKKMRGAKVGEKKWKKERRERKWRE